MAEIFCEKPNTLQVKYVMRAIIEKVESKNKFTVDIGSLNKSKIRQMPSTNQLELKSLAPSLKNGQPNRAICCVLPDSLRDCALM